MLTRPLTMRGLVAGIVALALLLFALVEVTGGDDETDTAPPEGPWSEIAKRAQGETVRLWMWGGEVALNEYMHGIVVPEAALLGVDLEIVPIDDTAVAMSRLVAEQETGTAEGAIDLLWVNGKNFEQGANLDLWVRNWVQLLPNSNLLDSADPALWSDFGVETDGQEVPWSRAAFVFAHDVRALPDPPMTFGELVDFARANPGRVAYPAPPDFTGSAFVRQAVQALGEDEAFALLAELDPLLWRGGETYPTDQAALDMLFAAGEIDIAMSYNPNFVDVAVGRGSFRETTRPFVFEGGTLQNVSFLAMPARATSPEAAMVVANLTLSPRMQRAKIEMVGIPSVLSASELGAGATPSPYRLVDFGEPLAELSAADVPDIDRRWTLEMAR